MRSPHLVACALVLAAAPARAEEGGTSVEIEAPPGAPPIEELKPPDLSGVPEECQFGAWSLEAPGTSADSFQPVWIVTLEQVARCLAEPKLARACVGVRGQVTPESLTPSAISTFGSPEAAKAMRARARASLVTGKLEDLGVDTSRIQELPAPRSSYYDGVSLGLLLSCGHAGAAVAGEGPELRAFVDLGGGGTLQIADELGNAAPGVLVGAGASLGRAFVRTSVAYASANRAEQSTSVDLTGALGWRLPGIVDPAVVGALRWGSVSTSEPWLERSWAVGVEGTHCRSELLGFADLCARAAVLPFGRIWRRAAEDPVGLRRVPEEGFGQTRLDLAVFLRRTL